MRKWVYMDNQILTAITAASAVKYKKSTSTWSSVALKRAFTAFLFTLSPSSRSLLVSSSASLHSWPADSPICNKRWTSNTHHSLKSYKEKCLLSFIHTKKLCYLWYLLIKCREVIDSMNNCRTSEASTGQVRELEPEPST